MKLRYATTNWKPKSSDLIPFADVALKPGDLIVLLCRESNRQRKSHLEYQEAWALKQLKKLGVVVTTIYKEVASASPAEDWDRQTLEKAALKAKELKATLVAMSTDRFIRGLWKKKVSLPPSVFDFYRLKFLTYGVKLATLLHPDTDPKIVRGIYTKMGIEARSKPGDLKRRRELLMPEALKLHKQGLSYRRIASALEVPLTTVYKWLH